jgi:hypothetical protein
MLEIPLETPVRLISRWTPSRSWPPPRPLWGNDGSPIGKCGDRDRHPGRPGLGYRFGFIAYRGSCTVGGMLLPILITELCSALEPVVGPDELLWQSGRLARRAP